MKAVRKLCMFSGAGQRLCPCVRGRSFNYVGTVCGAPSLGGACINACKGKLFVVSGRAGRVARYVTGGDNLRAGGVCDVIPSGGKGLFLNARGKLSFCGQGRRAFAG